MSNAFAILHISVYSPGISRGIPGEFPGISRGFPGTFSGNVREMSGNLEKCGLHFCKCFLFIVTGISIFRYGDFGFSFRGFPGDFPGISRDSPGRKMSNAWAISHVSVSSPGNSRGIPGDFPGISRGFPGNVWEFRFLIFFCIKHV